MVVMNYQAGDGQSIFNAGITKLMRIDKLKCIIHEARLTNNYFIWYECLLGIWEEVNEMITDEERKKCFEYKKSCLKINSMPNKKDKNPYTYDKEKLLDFGMYLGTLEHTYGMGMPKQKATSFTD